MPRVGFEPTIRAFEQVKTVYASDRAATVIGSDTVSVIKDHATKMHEVVGYSTIS
jgi:hypothetical protein